MKKIHKNEMNNISGGIKCGWVGVLAITSLISISNYVIVHATTGSSLFSHIDRCWNS